MTRYDITAPERHFSGEVAGVVFSNGKATVDGDADGAPAALAYFRRKGYGVGGDEPVQPGGTFEPADPRDVAAVEAARLRDGTVNPAPGDAGLPTNAGQAKPHGQAVVSPGYGTPPPAADAAVNEDAEELGEERAPARSASKAEWQDYARSQAKDSEENDTIDGMTKEQLVERYGGKG